MSKNKHKMMSISLLFIVAIMAVPYSAFCADGQIKIGQTSSTTFPISINSSGSYVLTSNLNVSSTSAHAIIINADHVTIDLNGHAIIGPGSGSGIGICASMSTHNTAVMNGTVRDFGYGGVFIEGENNIIKDVRAYYNGMQGIGVNNGTVTNCTANRNYGGIYANRSTITNCVVNFNNSWGIYAPFSTVTNCSANYNMYYGIYVSTSTVTNCSANYNTDDGINALVSTLTNCTVSVNTGNGICANYSTVTNCTANYNTGDGIEGENKNRIEGNNLRNNGGYGLYLSGDKNYAIKNTASDNTTGQFNDAGSNNHMPTTTEDNANWNP